MASQGLDDGVQFMESLIVTGDGIASEAPINAFEQQVLNELEQLRNPRGNWAKTIALLVISAMLFVALGMRDSPVAFIVLLVGAVFFHELGHYLGMKLFGYRNVRMFFIPFFGAAVSGQNCRAKGYQEAIVTLLGPVPGLIVAAGLLLLARHPGFDHEMRLELVRAALLFGFLNAFNLLPIYPLDGGRLLNQLLFSRNRYLEVVFQLVAALALIAYGISRGGSALMLFLGMAILLGLASHFKTSTIATRVKQGRELPPGTSLEGPIPVSLLRNILRHVGVTMPAVQAPRATAAVVFRVWERLHVQPPGLLTTALLLLVYLIAAALTLPWLIVILHATKNG